MAALTVPKQYQSALADLVSLDDASFAELLEAIKNAKLSFTSEALSTSITANVKSISSDRIDSIIELLTSLHFIRSGVYVPLEDFVDDLIEGAEESELKETVAKSRDAIKPRFITLLREKAIGFAATARAAERNYERSYCNAEMLTDIRPIFANGDGPPIAAVLTHTLKISFHQRERLKDIFITLAPDDLDELEALIEQAQVESEQLMAALDKAQIAHPEGIPTLSLSDDNEL